MNLDELALGLLQCGAAKMGSQVQVDVDQAQMRAQQVDPAVAVQPVVHPLRRDYQVLHRQFVAVLERVVPGLDGVAILVALVPFFRANQREGQTRLRVEIDQQHVVAAPSQFGADIGGQGRLAHAAFVIDD